MSELLTCEGLTKHYGAKTALDGVDLHIGFGKIVGLLGPNGSGKTTLIKLANGLLQPDSGSIRIAGMKPGVESKAIVSYLPDADWLPGWMRVEQLVKMFGDFYKDFDPARANEMLANLELSPKDVLKTLSKGNREKVQLILAMSRNARLYLLDEPIGGVDPAARDYILHTILSNYSKDATVLISTHLIEDIEPVLDEAIFLKEGTVFAHRSVDEIRDEVWDNGSSQIWAYLMFAYFAIGVAIGVVCIVTIIQRFTKNLLGREGYLMHTLPVHPEQLVASKLISSMVWVICSGVVGILSVLLMLVGLCAFEDSKTVINGETITTGWGDILKFSWKAIQSIGGEFWSELAWIIVLGLAGVAVLILCIYAACMIGHQFRNHSTIASILAFFLLQLIQGKLDAGGGIRVIVGSVAAMPMAYSASGNLWLVLLVTILIGAVYFVLTSWLMKNKLDLE